MRPQDVPQEMERNEATAKHVDWPSCAWLLLRFFPFPVGNPVAAHGINRSSLALLEDPSNFAAVRRSRKWIIFVICWCYSRSFFKGEGLPGPRNQTQRCMSIVEARSKRWKSVAVGRVQAESRLSAICFRLFQNLRSMFNPFLDRRLRCPSVRPIAVARQPKSSMS